MTGVSVRRVMRIAEFRAALREFQNQSEVVLRARKLTPQRYMLLLFIKGARDGTCRPMMTELRERMKLSANTVTELVDRAERDGFVAREANDDDQRFVFVRLTAKGETAIDEAIHATAAHRTDFAKLESLAQAFDAAVQP